MRRNAGIEAAYRKRLDALVREMQADLVATISRVYGENPPEMAADMTPAVQLRMAMRALSRRWLARFEDTAPQLATYFATAVQERQDAALRGMLRRGGISVRFNPTPAMQDVLEATIGENIALIKSIPEQHLAEVQGLVMRSVARGRDLGSVAPELAKRYGITMRRAALIARDQNNKATAVMSATRQLDLGIEEGEWLHSAGGKTPRPSHVKAGRERVRFNLREGWYDPDEGKFVLPGELINCRCTWRPVLPGAGV